jgi:outer membrane lipoprotein carrier protein
MMYRPMILLGLLAYSLVGSAAVNVESESAVVRYFRDLQSLRADFVQTVYNDQARLLQTSNGQMVMEKPGRFRWDYEKPFRQVIVADGERLWIYDQDLQQVTVRRLDKALSATPLALLSGAAPLDKAFTVSAMHQEGGLSWYELRPKQAQTEFKLLRVAFAGDTLQILELEDGFNQRTRLSFAKLQRNVAIDPGLLRFVPPAGVDVVGDWP